MGKEKKRKKLDEIVLGLSAAKEQKTFPDPSLPTPIQKKPHIPPSVSVIPANLQSSLPLGSSGSSTQHSQQSSHQKPFTITVTTVPGSEFDESLIFSTNRRHILFNI